MNQKLLLIGFIALVLVGVGSYILGTKKSQPVQTNTSNSISISPTAVQSNEMSDETTNWKTYISEEYKFSIKYPSDVLHETTFGSTQFNKSHKLFKINGGILKIYGLCGRGAQPIRTIDVQIDGHKTTKAYETDVAGFITAIPRPNSNENICFNFSLPPEPNTQSVDTLFNQILSTFRFSN